MFPDLTSEWSGYPSVIDGIRSPYVGLIGGPPGYINLLVRGECIEVAAYGISIRSLLHWVVNEFEYSVTGHGLPTLGFDGINYIRRAQRSQLLQAYQNGILNQIFSEVQHFAFVGGEDCVEVLTDDAPPTIVALKSGKDCDEWVRKIGEEIQWNFSSDD